MFARNVPSCEKAVVVTRRGRASPGFPPGSELPGYHKGNAISAPSFRCQCDIIRWIRGYRGAGAWHAGCSSSLVGPVRRAPCVVWSRQAVAGMGVSRGRTTWRRRAVDCARACARPEAKAPRARRS